MLKPALTLIAGFWLIAADTQDRYGNCVAMTKTTPKAAYALASQWRAQGGGPPAMHCQALALLAQEAPARAAGVLDAASELLANQPATHADLLAQAGNAWLLANDPTRGLARLSAALTLMPEQGLARADVLMDRARAHGALENKVGALADLTAALRLAPKNPQIWLLRAEIYLSNGATDLATADLAAARALPLDSELTALHIKLVEKAAQKP